jgi:small redox-active disulfide protein 2
MKIQIIGMGCPKCRQMTAEVTAVVAQLGLDAEIGRIDDPQTIVQMGIFSLPQLMIDGQLVQFRHRGRHSIEDLLTKRMTEKI